MSHASLAVIPDLWIGCPRGHLPMPHTHDPGPEGAGVQPLSHCRVPARDGVVDRISGACGVIVQVTRLTWVHAAAADVVGGYDLTPRHAASFRDHVEHDGRNWAVTAAQLLWQV